MNILILTGHFGMGHICASNAIAQEILADVPDADIHIVDMIEYMFPHFKDLIYNQFNFMVKSCSHLYNFCNKLAGRYNDVPLKHELVRKVERMLREYRPDIVISTLPACSQYISAYKEITGMTIPLYTYITDISAHGEWISKGTDMYFVGAQSTKNTLIANGIPERCITVSGIPVAPNFKPGRCALPHGKKTEILIMGGGLGLIPYVDRMVDGLYKDDKLHITMICGKNLKLSLKMKKRYPKIEVLGYTDRVSEYMKRADLLITKAGGITTFEAINCHTPLYIFTPFLVQEIGNAEFIEQNNIGKVVWSKDTNAVSDILALTQNTSLLNLMKRNMCALQSQLCPKPVVSQILRDSVGRTAALAI
ncbi:MAG: glycosyltransferase [Oscillospiraceae bacterium]